MKYAKVFGILLSAGMLFVSCGKMQDGADVSQSGIVWGNQWLVPVGTDSATGSEVTLEDPHWTDEFLRVMAVNNVLFPTFGSPTIPNFICFKSPLFSRVFKLA